MSRIRSIVARFLAVLLVLTACGRTGDEARVTAPTPPTSAPSARTASGPIDVDTSTTTVSAVQGGADADHQEATTVRASNGRVVPVTAASVEEAVALFIDVERGLRRDDLTPDAYADLGHTEQLLIRKLRRNPDWIEPFRSELPADLLTVADLHLNARRELGLLHVGGGPPIDDIPAWAVIEPAPLEDLTSFYKSAAEQTGIEWQVLAAINLIETGMGRIDGLSSAGAQGPMQFLPTTWAEVSQGGDIDDPENAIHGAARYLVQRGGHDDIRDGLWGYNNSDHYVNAVLAYSELVQLDERALRGFYNWEIYVGTSSGTLWLPVGYLSTEAAPAADYLDTNPWALTLG